MPSTPTIRPLTAGDAAAWRRLWTDYLAFYEARVSEEVYAASFARLLDPEMPEMAGLIAFRGETALGLVHYLFHRHFWRPEGVCYLQDLFVAPAARGTGLGRALIEAVYRKADAAGTPTVYWMTQEFNATARRLYDRVGEKTPFIKYQRSAA